ncbi:hypothetical protein BGZ74_006097 [Mortierella antarctica]|nr:hypothetical protein BGZ74_006097 [Mortierella antarctica]
MSTASDGGFLEDDGHYGDRRDNQYGDPHGNLYDDHHNIQFDDSQFGDHQYDNQYDDIQYEDDDHDEDYYKEPLSREQQQKQRDDFDKFERIIRFLEANLASVVGVHEPQVGASIESRLQTVINSMAADEQRHAKTLAENAKLKADEGRGRVGDLSDRPNKPVEETLTRVMQESAKELASLKVENTTLQSTQISLQEQLAAATHEKEAMELELSEAKINADNLNKELTKSEKGRRTAQSVKEAKEKDLVRLEDRFKSLDKHYLDKEKLVTKLQKENDRLQKENDDRKRDFVRVKSASLTRDLEKISALEASLQNKDKQLEEQKQKLRDSNESLQAMVSKCKRLEDDEDRGLESFGKFRSDLAQVTLALSDNEVKTKKLEAALVVAHQDLESIGAKATKDRQLVQHELAVAQKLAQDREKENKFLKASIAQADLSAQDYRRHTEEDATMIRDLEAQVHELKTEAMVHERTTAQLRQHLQSHIWDLAEQTKLTNALAEDVKNLKESIRKMGGEITDKDLTARYLALESLQNQVKTLNQQLGRASRAPSHQAESGDLLDGSLEPACIRNMTWLYNGLHRTTNDLIDALGSVVSLRQEVSEAMAGSHQDRDEILEKFHRAESELQAVTATLKAEKDERAEELKEKEAMKTEIDQLTLNMEQHSAAIEAQEAEVGEELRLELERAVDRMESLAAVVAVMEEEAVTMIRTRDEMDERNSQLKVSLKLAEEKIERLEKEIERRNKDLEQMVPELAGARSTIQERDGAIQHFGETVQDLKKTISNLEQENMEQAAVVDGREKALARLDEARQMYDKVFESKVARLKEDKQIWEKRVEAEWARVRGIHEQELKSLMEKYSSATAVLKWNLESQQMSFEQERGVLTKELEEAKKNEESLQNLVDKLHVDIVDRNELIAGYMDFVTTQAEGVSVPENKGPWPKILEKRHTDIVKIEELEQKITSLTEALDGQMEILKTYDQNMANFSDKHQSYLTQMRDLEVELSEEKRQRAHEQKNYASLLETVATMQNLEKDLMTKLSRPRRSDSDSGILSQGGSGRTGEGGGSGS